jgi:uncharacterized protein (DUF1499 family)
MCLGHEAAPEERPQGGHPVGGAGHVPVVTPLAWLLGLLLPACAASGANGVPPPPPDLLHLARPGSPNTSLAAPEGFRPASGPAPDITAHPYALPPADLIARLRTVAESQPRTYPRPSPAGQPDRADWVARSRVFNFPDLVSAQALPQQGGGALLILYSASVYGRSDFGVNHGRLKTWLAALDRALGITHAADY